MSLVAMYRNEIAGYRIRTFDPLDGELANQAEEALELLTGGHLERWHIGRGGSGCAVDIQHDLGELGAARAEHELYQRVDAGESTTCRSTDPSGSHDWIRYWSPTGPRPFLIEILRYPDGSRGRWSAARTPEPQQLDLEDTS